MFKFIFAVAAVALVLWIFQQQLPDIERYMKIRSM
jgi:hypothetical protein